jgi:hypothetical protein
MAVAANADGGEIQPGIHALTYAEVDQIRERVNSLNPYTGPAGKDILKREHDRYAYAISAKRYALFNYEDGKPVVFDYKEHGLGLYLNPADIDSPDRNWMRQLWQHIVNQAHGIDSPLPEWIDRPALTRSSVSSPHLMTVFRRYNDGKDYPDIVKPFGFMLLASEADRMKVLEGAKPRRFITGYSSDPAQWESADWYDLHNPSMPPVRLGGNGIPVKTFRQVLAEYMAHPEPKFLGPDGEPCNSRSAGVLARRIVRVGGINHIGKESNKLEETQEGQFNSWDDIITDYGSPANTDLARIALQSTSLRNLELWINVVTLRFRQWQNHEFGNGYLGVPGAEVPVTVIDWNYRNRISLKVIRNYAEGKKVSRAAARQLTRFAAMLVLSATGIEYNDVLWSSDLHRLRYTPRTVLAVWNELGRPSPFPWNIEYRDIVVANGHQARLCQCGCGRPAKQKYHKQSCYQKMYRNRAKDAQVEHIH